MSSAMPNRRNGVIEHRELLPVTLDRGRLRSFCPRCTHLSRLSTRFGCKKLRQPAQIHHRRREREQQLNLGQAAQLHLAQDAVLLGIAEHGLDELAGELTDLISGVARRAAGGWGSLSAG